MRPIVESIITDTLTLYLDDLKNAAVGQAIVSKAVQAAKVREAAAKAKDVARAKSTLETAALIGKFSSCTGKKAEQNELFIVRRQRRRQRQAGTRPALSGGAAAARQAAQRGEKTDRSGVGKRRIRSIITALGTGIDRILT